jgi:hypothetical protein
LLLLSIFFSVLSKNFGPWAPQWVSNSKQNMKSIATSVVFLNYVSFTGFQILTSSKKQNYMEGIHFHSSCGTGARPLLSLFPKGFSFQAKSSEKAEYSREGNSLGR